MVMAAPVPFALEHVLDAVVDACLQELTAARHETAIVRAATAAERRELEQQLAERDAELERARLEGQAATENVIALRRRITELERAPTVRLSPPSTAVEEGEAMPAHSLTKPLKPPGKSRLSGLSTLVGMTFGCWEVLERAPSVTGMTRWKCRCTTCGRALELAALGPHGLRTRPPKCKHPKKQDAAAKGDDEAESDELDQAEGG